MGCTESSTATSKVEVFDGRSPENNNPLSSAATLNAAGLPEIDRIVHNFSTAPPRNNSSSSTQEEVLSQNTSRDYFVGNSFPNNGDILQVSSPTTVEPDEMLQHCTAYPHDYRCYLTGEESAGYSADEDEAVNVKEREIMRQQQPVNTKTTATDSDGAVGSLSPDQRQVANSQEGEKRLVVQSRGASVPQDAADPQDTEEDYCDDHRSAIEVPLNGDQIASCHETMNVLNPLPPFLPALSESRRKSSSLLSRASSMGAPEAEPLDPQWWAPYFQLNKKERSFPEREGSLVDSMMIPVLLLDSSRNSDTTTTVNGNRNLLGVREHSSYCTEKSHPAYRSPTTGVSCRRVDRCHEVRGWLDEHIASHEYESWYETSDEDIPGSSFGY